MFFEDWISSVDMHLFTDASNLAGSGFFDGEWFVVPFVLDLAWIQQMSINWREMFAIVVAAATFGRQWSGRRTMLHCDNQCVVNVISSGSCRSSDIMILVRSLFYISAMFNFEVSCCYVNTKLNSVADSLSRLQFERFFSLAPCANKSMTFPCLNMIPVV